MLRGLHSARRPTAFTLTELLIAVGVLVVVITAAAKIFSASSKVAAVAEANADLIQTATAIESQIRADFANIPRNAFMVIQQVEVNAFGQQQSPAVDPSLGTAEIRADQVAFFTRGIRQTTQYTGSQESNRIDNVAQEWTAESAIARVYYGHGVVAPSLPLGIDPTVYGEGLREGATLVPWAGGQVETEQSTTNSPAAPRTLIAQRASNWPLARLATLLSTDGLPTTLNAGNEATSTPLPRLGSSSINAGISLFTNRAIRLSPLATAYPEPRWPLWTSGRVDVVKWQPDDLFSQMAYQANSQQVPQAIGFIPTAQTVWGTPSSRLRMIQTLANWAAPATFVNPSNGASQLFLSYPRVEKAAPSSAKTDQMLTAPVLAPNCSSFKVEWTWAHGTGASFGGAGGAVDGTEAIGMFVRSGGGSVPQPWFGLDRLQAQPNGSVVRNLAASTDRRPVSNGPNFLDGGNFSEWGTIGRPLIFGDSQSELICSVEGPMNNGGDGLVNNSPIWRCSPKQDGKRVYQAVFGFNQTDPSITNPAAAGRGPYTPLPSAIRITLRLHDPLGRIEGGREFQFIVDLPRR